MFVRKSGVIMKNINLVDVDLKRDIQEISTFIQNYVDSTYLSQIRSQVRTHKRQTTESPFAEVQLLEAVLPFVEGETKSKLSSVIKMITYSKMIEKMLPDYGVENLFTRTNKEKGLANEYIHQAVVVLVLYKIIAWAEE